MTKTFQRRPVVGGSDTAHSVVTHQGFNTLASINTAGSSINRKGLCKDQSNPELYGKQIPDQALCLPETIGSTTGGVLFSVVSNGYASACMLFSKRVDPLVLSGAVLLKNWSKHSMVLIDELGDDFLDFVKDRMQIQTSENGTEVVSDK